METRFSQINWKPLFILKTLTNLILVYGLGCEYQILMILLSKGITFKSVQRDWQGGKFFCCLALARFFFGKIYVKFKKNEITFIRDRFIQMY